MTPDQTRSTLGIVASTIACLLLLVPGPISERLEEAGHDHEDELRVSVEAVHTTLPAHFDAASVDAEHACSACLLSGRTVIRAAAVRAVGALPPSQPAGVAPQAWLVTKGQRRLDLSRAPPRIL